MNREEFDRIAAILGQENGVELGKMMSAPGLKYNNKVFAFFYKEAMIFKLGNEKILQDFGIDHFELLSPFKTKPPLKGWFVIDGTYRQLWMELARTALERMQVAF